MGKFGSRAEQKAQRPSQILDAAFEEFVEKGYTATRVEDIAKRIEVTKGTVYVYFPTKEDLFAAMIKHISTPFADVLALAASETGTCTERLRRLIQTSYERLLANRQTRELLRFVIAEGSRFPDVVDLHHREFVMPLKKFAQSILDQGVANGEFRESPAAVSEVVLSPLLSAIVGKLIFDDRKPFDLGAHVDAHLDLVLNGLMSR